MEPFRTLTALAAPLDRANVDTDQIIPKQFLKRIERTGYGDFLFFDWRQTPRRRRPIADFVLNDPRYKGAQILIAGQELWLRIEPRARRVGAERLRISRGDRADVRRHLFLECGQERHCFGSPERGGGRYAARKTRRKFQTIN